MGREGIQGINASEDKKKQVQLCLLHLDSKVEVENLIMMKRLD
jgi:hypothetical protein